MTYHSVIRNFRNIGSTPAEKLREQLSLSMPADVLKLCASYYKNREKRDPYVDELKMLDMLVSIRDTEGVVYAPTEFFTNDAFVARTYADLLKKRKQLYPDLSHPCTFGEAVNLASKYIRYARDARTSPRTVLIPENMRDSAAYPDATCVAAPQSAYRMRLLPITLTETEDNDTLILMTSVSENNRADFRRKAATLLCNAELMQFVKGVASVGRGGILRELLDITDGALIRLSSFSPIESSMPATVLCDGYCGSYILRVLPNQVSTVFSLLTKGGVRAIPFAQIRQGGKFIFARDMRDRSTAFSLDTHFLYALSRRKTCSAKLADEATLSPERISFGGIGGGICSYLAPDSASPISEVVKMDKTACVAASAMPTQAHYKTALWSVLAPVASLCARGVPYSEQSLSLALEIPADLTDSATVGSCMSTILGLYRAQTELGLATAGNIVMRSTENLKYPTVTAWTLSQNALNVASTFGKAGSLVYAVSPSMNTDGLPDFSSLRQLFNQIADFAKQNKILSCRVLTAESVTDGIRKMSNTHTCVLSDTTVAAEGKLPLCILIESDALLPLKQIGKVHPYKRLPREAVEIPDRTDLIAGERPEVVIVASLYDNNAAALAAILEDRGAAVSLFTAAKGDAAALSRAMLTAQALILCPNAILPQTKQIDFALDTLRRAGSILLSLSPKNISNGFIYLKNGFNEEIFQKICR